MELQQFFAGFQRVAVAFSGGVDSSYLLYAAKACGCDVRAYFIKSPFQPDFELEDARKLARQLDVPLHIEVCDVLQNPAVAANPPDRCYYCKRTLFSKLLELASSDGCDLLCDGTNASDDINDRPGMKALAELGVRSPLRECNLTKSDIRIRSKAAGLFTHDKPAYACLATRIPAGQPITAELLGKVERGESALFALGFSDFRIRVFHDAAKLQLPENQLLLAVQRHHALTEALSPDFDGVLLDLNPR